MKDYTVIQRLVPVTSFLARLSSYVRVVWTKRQRPAVITQPPLVLGPETWHWKPFFLSAAHPGREDETPRPVAMRTPAGTGKHVSTSRFSAAGDWLAPIIVWALVILMGLAIVGFLLGER